jgi:hypothetical protein
VRFATLDRLGVSLARIAALAGAVSAGAALLTRTITGEALGEGRDGAALIVGALVFYCIISAPRRIADSQRLAEARESPMLSASAATCLAVTGSRPRTILIMSPRDPVLKASLRDAGRKILLGTRADKALESSAQDLVSYSALAAFKGLASFTPEGVVQGDEEVQGLASSSDLSRETKVPMLMTVCLFAPVLLILYAVFSHTYGAVSLAELASLEFIVLDLAFFLSAAGGNLR